MNINATVIVQVLTFLGFVALCRRFVWPPIMAVIVQRQQEQAEGLQRARQGEKLLEKAQEEYDLKTHSGHQKYQEIIANAQKEYKQRLDDAQADAQLTKQSALKQAATEIAQERQAANQEIADEMSELIHSALTKILGKIPEDIKIDEMIASAVEEIACEKQ